jgi:Zn-finger nucleic acid-binding protein
MRCPVDNTELAMSDRQGIEIDYCPKCRGVWLDRGELDKIIERSARDDIAPPSFSQPHHSVDNRYRDEGRRDDHYRDDRGYGSQKHKKKSLLGDIFDF